jgi:hypothetical protein
MRFKGHPSTDELCSKNNKDEMQNAAQPQNAADDWDSAG